MPEPLLADSLDRPLDIGGAGDVVEARRWAASLTTNGCLLLTNPILATMVLTAVCLHVDSQVGGAARRRDVARCLEDLAIGRFGNACLASSPMQFVRYAAVELRSLLEGDQARLFRALGDLVSRDERESVPREGYSHSLGNAHNVL